MKTIHNNLIFAFFSWFEGVLQIEVIQNSPHRQLSWLNGQYIFPQACEPPTWTRQFWDSANWMAFSIAFLGCLFLFNEISTIIHKNLVVNRQPINWLHWCSTPRFLANFQIKQLSFPFKRAESSWDVTKHGTVRHGLIYAKGKLRKWTNQPFGGS